MLPRWLAVLSGLPLLALAQPAPLPAPEKPALRVGVAGGLGASLERFVPALARELGLPIEIRERATGGGTDAAFAGLRPRGGVLESFGLRGFGSHSNDDEYILVSNIAPRLYLATRMVMDTGSGRVSW